MKYRYFKQYGKELPLPEVDHPSVSEKILDTSDAPFYKHEFDKHREWLSSGIHVPDEHLWYFEGVDRDESEFYTVEENGVKTANPKNYPFKAEESKEQRVYNKTASGYSYRDYEQEDMILKDRIIEYLSGRQKGDGIEWNMIYEMMNEYHHAKVESKEQEDSPIEEYLKSRIKQLNEADVAFCGERWLDGIDIGTQLKRQIAREESNKVTFARQELEEVLKRFKQITQ